MSKYEIFEKIINAYNTGNDGAMNFYTMQLLAEETGNPYQLGYEEAEIFGMLPTYYKQATSGRAGCFASEREISKNMKKLLSISTMNPYGKAVFFNQENTQEGEEPAEEPKKVKHVFGVIPVEEIQIVSEPKKEPDPTANIGFEKYEPVKTAEENLNKNSTAKKFSRRKKR